MRPYDMGGSPGESGRPRTCGDWPEIASPGACWHEPAPDWNDCRRRRRRGQKMKHERFDTTDRNAAIFMAPGVARRYGNPAPFAAEAMILLRYKEAFAGKRVLDLGVGAGRTTQYLAPFASHYLGIDLSPAMLALARSRYPNVRFADMDLREIGKLQSESFDFIFGPWNILSAFSHDERIQIMRR